MEKCNPGKKLASSVESESQQRQGVYRIVTPYFCCGVVTTEDGRIIEAAPIVAWAIGKNIISLQAWTENHGYSIKKLN